MGRVAAITAALLLFSSPAFAQCDTSIPFGNFLGTVAECDDSGPVVGSVQAIDGDGLLATTINDSFICLAESQLFCGATLAGIVGDNLIAFGGSWGSASRVIGCPTNGGGLAGGRNFYNITDASGNLLLFSVGRDPIVSYAADNAWPSDSSGNILANLTCDDPRNDITLVSQTVEGNSATVQLICEDPQIRSDCDPDSLGIMIGRGSCLASDPAFLESLTALNLYSTVADCSGRGLNYAIAQGGWSLQPYIDLGGGIRETTVILSPTECVFLGCSFGTETPSTSGTCSNNGSTCSVDGDCGNECNGGTNDGLTCVDNAGCLGACSLDATLACADDAGCFGVFGICTVPPPGTCESATCVPDPPIQNEYRMIYSAAPLDPSGCDIEICDGLDNDCDTLIDEELGQTACGVGACLRVVDNCVGGQVQSCVPGAPTTEICDGIDNDCNGLVDEVDADGDGFTCAADCDDGDPLINPVATEVCNGIDDNCNGLVDDDGSGLDSDGDGVPNACDNCIDAFNPAQADTDGDGIGNSCDNCLAVVNVDQTDTDSDGNGDACDNCPTEFNSAQADLDEDGVGDVCDNCLFDPNVDQGDIDDDFEGDVCDLNDGLIYTTALTQTVLGWQQEMGFDTFNVYRGDVSLLVDGDGDGAADDYCADRIAEFLAGTAFGDTTVPAVGAANFHVVTGNGMGGESDFGSASSGAPRFNTDSTACLPP